MADQIQMASPEEVDLELEDDTDAYRSNVESSALSTDVILSEIHIGRLFEAAGRTGRSR